MLYYSIEVEIVDIDKVYQKIENNGIKLFSYDIPDSKAITIEVDNDYGIFIDYNKIDNCDEEFIILSHEYGHCMSGATHKLNSNIDIISRHEYRADRKAIMDFLPIDLLKQAIDYGCKLLYEFADFLDLPEDFIRKAFEHYTAMGLLKEMA